MTKKIFVLSGHLGQERFGHALADSYEVAATKAGADVKRMNLNELSFENGLLAGDQKNQQELEPDLKKFQEHLSWSEHWVLVYPLWWGGMPGPLKSLMDRTLLPDFAFKYQEGKPFPAKLMKGRTARVMITSDTPGWYLNWVYGAGGNKAVKRQILEFIGFEKSKFENFGPMQSSKPSQREKWLDKAKAFAVQDAK